MRSSAIISGRLRHAHAAGWAATLWLLTLSATAAPLARPDADEYVRDLAHLLNPVQRSAVQELGDRLMRDEGVPLLVLTLPRLADAAASPTAAQPTAAGVARRCFTDWSVQHPLLPGPDWGRGVLLLIVERDRRARLELGPGWRGEHDAEARQLTEQLLFPALRRGQPGVAATTTLTALDAVIRRRPVPPVPVSTAEVVGWSAAAAALTLGLISLLRRGRRGRAARLASRLLALPATLLDLLPPPAVAEPVVVEPYAVSAESAEPPVSEWEDRLGRALGQLRESTGERLTVVVLERAGVHGRAKSIAGVTLGLAAACGTWWLLPDLAAQPDSWAGYTPGARAGLAAGVLAVGSWLGTLAATHLPAIARPFLSRREIDLALHNALPRYTASSNRLAKPAGYEATEPTRDRATSQPGSSRFHELLLLVSRYEGRAVLVDLAPRDDRRSDRELARWGREIQRSMSSGDPLSAVVDSVEARAARK